MRSNIKLGVNRLLPPALLILLNHVISKLTDNEVFPTPPMNVVDMGSLRTGLDTAIDNAIGGSVEARTIRDAISEEVRDVLRSTADYVRAQSNGDAVKLASSGFTLAKQPQPINVVGTPANVTAHSTNVTGDVLVRWGKTEGARMCRVERAMSDPTVGSTTWQPVGQTSRQSFVVTGLQPYEACWFRVVGIGKISEGLPSDVVMGRAA